MPNLLLAEAASLHDHLTYRYDTMHLTNIFTSIAHDLDFQAVLHMGLTRLNKQITLLEKQLKAYHVPFLNGQGIHPFPTNVRFFEDDTIFRTIDSFMQVPEASTLRRSNRPLTTMKSVNCSGICCWMKWRYSMIS